MATCHETSEKSSFFIVTEIIKSRPITVRLVCLDSFYGHMTVISVMRFYVSKPFVQSVTVAASFNKFSLERVKLLQNESVGMLTTIALRESVQSASTSLGQLPWKGFELRRVIVTIVLIA